MDVTDSQKKEEIAVAAQAAESTIEDALAVELKAEDGVLVGAETHEVEAQGIPSTEVASKEELSIERKEPVSITNTQTDDQSAVAGQTTATDDSDEPKLKYYGYQVSENVLDSLDKALASSIDSANRWLGIWLSRIFDKKSN